MLDPLAVLRCRKNIAGFTLIELLVVVSIVALLVGILVPSLRSAREQARIVVCTANLKGIAAASLTYATSDSGEQAVPIHGLTGKVLSDVAAYDWGGKSGIGEPAMGTDPTASRWGTQNGRGPGTRPLNDILFKSHMPDHINDPGDNSANWRQDYEMDLPLFRCPSDRGFTGHHYPAFAASGLRSYDHYGTSYVANELWGRAGDVLVGGGPALRPVTMIPNPGNTYYYIENCGRFAWTVNTSDAAAVYWYSRPVLELAEWGVARGWHGRPFHFVAGFVDGHANAIHMRGRQEPGPTLSQYPYGHVAFLRRAVTRGPGWQKDAFGTAVLTVVPSELNLITAAGP